MRAVRPFLFGGLSSRTTLAAFAKRKRPSVGRYFQRQRVSPAPPRHLARIVPVFVPTWSLPHRARRFGLAIAPQQRLYNHHSRAEGLVREKSQLGG